MAISKVILNGTTLIDTTDKTVTSSTLVSPNTALGADGTTVTGTLVAKTSTDVTISGPTVTIPGGVYSSQVEKSVVSGTATTPSTTITANPTITVNSSGLITASVSKTQSVTPSVSAGYVSIGTSGTVSVSGSNTSQLSTQAAATITPSTSSQTAVTSGKYTTGAVTVDPIPSQYIVPTGSVSITTNGTVDVTQYASASVNVSGGGGTSNWTLLASQEETVSTTNTRTLTVATISAGASAYTKDSVLWVHIRDKAGARAGYFFGSDVIFMNPWAANNESTLITTKSSQIFRYSADSKFESTTTTYGIYAYSLSSSGDIVIYSRYSSSSSLTINGTYLIEVYLLSMPSGDKLFN